MNAPSNTLANTVQRLIIKLSTTSKHLIESQLIGFDKKRNDCGRDEQPQLRAKEAGFSGRGMAVMGCMMLSSILSLSLPLL